MSPATVTPPPGKRDRTPRRASEAVVVTIRRQGGARVMTLPPALLALLGADAGTALALAVKGGALVATPVVAPARRRYTLAELLEGAEHLPALYAGTAGALDGPAFGGEIG